MVNLNLTLMKILTLNRDPNYNPNYNVILNLTLHITLPSTLHPHHHSNLHPHQTVTLNLTLPLTLTLNLKPNLRCNHIIKLHVTLTLNLYPNTVLNPQVTVWLKINLILQLIITSHHNSTWNYNITLSLTLNLTLKLILDQDPRIQKPDCENNDQGPESKSWSWKQIALNPNRKTYTWIQTAALILTFNPELKTEPLNLNPNPNPEPQTMDPVDYHPDPWPRHLRIKRKNHVMFKAWLQMLKHCHRSSFTSLDLLFRNMTLWLGLPFCTGFPWGTLVLTERKWFLWTESLLLQDWLEAWWIALFCCLWLWFFF